MAKIIFSYIVPLLIIASCQPANQKSSTGKPVIEDSGSGEACCLGTVPDRVAIRMDRAGMESSALVSIKSTLSAPEGMLFIRGGTFRMGARDA
jgi:hypothetical protein